MPHVSIIMPAYNQEKYIGQAIGSVLEQQYIDWELIIIDDESTDETKTVVAQFDDPRIRYEFQSNQERSCARNNGIQLAQGKFVAFLDADDFWLPGYLEKQVANLNNNPNIGLSRTCAYITDESGTRVRVGGCGAQTAKSQSEFLTALLIGNRMTNSAVVVRHECLDEVGGFDPELRQGEDWDLWLRIAMRYAIGTVPEPLVGNRHYNIFMPPRLIRRDAGKAHIRIVHKAFEQLKESPLYSLRSKALGFAYWHSAWLCYAVEDIAGGQSEMNRAFRVYPDLFSSPYQEFIQAVAYQADELNDLYTPLLQGLSCIDNLFNNLPDWAHPLKRFQRAAKGYFSGLQLFQNYEQRNWGNVCRAARVAVLYRPNWLLNRGFLSIMVQMSFALFSFSRTLNSSKASS